MKTKFTQDARFLKDIIVAFKLSTDPEKDILDGNVRINGKRIYDPKYRVNLTNGSYRIIAVKQKTGELKCRTL